MNSGWIDMLERRSFRLQPGPGGQFAQLTRDGARGTDPDGREIVVLVPPDRLTQSSQGANRWLGSLVATLAGDGRWDTRVLLVTTAAPDFFIRKVNSVRRRIAPELRWAHGKNVRMWTRDWHEATWPTAAWSQLTRFELALRGSRDTLEPGDDRVVLEFGSRGVAVYCEGRCVLRVEQRDQRLVIQRYRDALPDLFAGDVERSLSDIEVISTGHAIRQELGLDLRSDGPAGEAAVELALLHRPGLMGDGTQCVGRQVRLGQGLGESSLPDRHSAETDQSASSSERTQIERLDLLTRDAAGGLWVVELKANRRSHVMYEALVQALDYREWIAANFEDYRLLIGCRPADRSEDPPPIGIRLIGRVFPSNFHAAMARLASRGCPADAMAYHWDGGRSIQLAPWQTSVAADEPRRAPIMYSRHGTGTPRTGRQSAESRANPGQEERFERFLAQCPDQYVTEFFGLLRASFGRSFYVGPAEAPWASLKHVLGRSFAHVFPGGKRGDARIEAYRGGADLGLEALDRASHLGILQPGGGWAITVANCQGRESEILDFLRHLQAQVLEAA